MFRKAIYGLAAIEIGALLVLSAVYLVSPKPGSGSGGPEMGFFFFELVPLVTLSAVLAVFHFARWRVLRGAAALVLVLPLAGLVYWGVDEATYQVTKRDYASGRDYFEAPAAKELAMAIIRGDAATVAAVAPTVDVNQVGEVDQTFIGLAMTRTDIDEAIVQALLDAGANPNKGKGWPLMVAIGRADARLTTMLLDAGADPNLVGGPGTPAFFEALDKPDLLALLLQRGALVDAVDDNGWTGLMRATWNERWPTVRLLLNAGANLGHVAPDGSGLGKAIAFRHYRADLEKQPVPPELLALEAEMEAARRRAGQDAQSPR